MSAPTAGHLIYPIIIWFPPFHYDCKVMDDSDMSMEGQKQCPICLDKLQKKVVKTVCGHFFCFAHIASWLNNSGTCPICRKDLTKLSPQDNNVSDIFFNIYPLPRGNLNAYCDKIVYPPIPSSRFYVNGCIVTTGKGEIIDPKDWRIEILSNILS